VDVDRHQLEGRAHQEGKQGGGYSSVNVPEVTTDDYSDIAQYVLNNDGTITYATGLPCAIKVCPANTGAWTFSDPDGALGPQMGTWTISGNSAPEGTFYVEGKVSISGSPKGPSNSALKMTLIAEGSISITGSPKLTPNNVNNPEAIMFVTNGDLRLEGATDLDDPTTMVGDVVVLRLRCRPPPSIDQPHYRCESAQGSTRRPQPDGSTLRRGSCGLSSRSSSARSTRRASASPGRSV
jgi:hypothetical protein